MNVLLVDDEALARQRLRRLLVDAADVTIVAECNSAMTALEALRTHQVDLVFLDVQMPGADGFAVADSLSGQDAPLIVFVTAHDTHAIRAFEARALDYLLKPVRKERLATAIERAREAVAARRTAAYTNQLRSVLAQLDEHAPVGTRHTMPAALGAGAGGGAGAERIEVRQGERIQYVAVEEVAWIEAQGAHVKLHTTRGVLETRETMARLESSLDPRRFTRVHRSYLVNIEHVRELQPWFGGDAILVMRDGQKLKVSRTYRTQLRERLNAV